MNHVSHISNSQVPSSFYKKKKLDIFNRLKFLHACITFFELWWNTHNKILTMLTIFTCSSLTYGRLAPLWQSLPSISRNFFLLPKLKVYINQTISIPLPPQLLETTILLSTHKSEFGYLDTVCKWNHIMYVFFYLAYFTCHNVFKVQPCYSMHQNFLPLRLSVIQL